MLPNDETVELAFHRDDEIVSPAVADGEPGTGIVVVARFPVDGCGRNAGGCRGRDGCLCRFHDRIHPRQILHHPQWASSADHQPEK